MDKKEEKIKMNLTPENMLFLARSSLELLQDFRKEKQKEDSKVLVKKKNINNHK